VSELRVTTGGVIVRLGPELGDFVRRLVEKTQTVTIQQIREAADEVAADARLAWYSKQGVKRRTGKSGDIRALEVVDIAKGEIRISVGSADDRMAGRRPVPVFVHRPTRTSTIMVDVSPGEWFAAPESMRAPWRPTPGGKKVARLHRPNPDASDGKKLLPTLVRSPMRKRAKAISAAIAKGVARGE